MRKIYEKPHALLDAILDEKKLRNDAELARFLKCTPGSISKIRNEFKPVVSEEFRMRVMRMTGWSLKRVDALAPLDAHPDSDGPRD